jgi:murein DD-endopeptidase MepM/ murein hydrolase activator NlpD
MPAFARAADASGALTGTVISTTSSQQNLQTMALLQPATNLDPSQNADSGDVTVVDNSAVEPQAALSPEAQSTSNGTISLYVVQPGDTLSSIAQLFGVSTNTILWSNNLSSGATLEVGEQLVILPISGVQYTVQKGDTLESIAKRFDGDAGDIASYNGVDDSSLVVGSTIIIPGGELGAAPASSSSGSTATAPISKAPAITASVTPTTTWTPTPSSQILQGWSASGRTIPFAHNPDEPVRGIGPVGTADQIAYYESPLPGSASQYVQTQNIHGYNAVDIAAKTGTPIIAAADGTVIVAKSGGWNGGYGSYVVIQHGNGSQTLYAHMSRVAATPGETVVQGQIIGYVGMTGDATGPHVHFEIRNGIRNPF